MATGVTPLDYLGAEQDWQRTLAETALTQEKARQAPLVTQEYRQRLSQEAFAQKQREQQAVADVQFQKELSQISQTLPAYERLGQMADAAMRAGRFKDAETILQRANQALSIESLKEQRAARAEEAKTKAASTKQARGLELLSGVNSPETKRLAEEMYKNEFGEEAPTARYPYSPQLIQFATQALTKKRDAAAQAADTARAGLAGVRASKVEVIADAQQRLLEARTAAVEKKAADDKKAGGKPVVPHRGEVSLTDDALKERFPDMSTAERTLAAREIASDAKMRQRDKGGEFKDNAIAVINENPQRFKRTAPGMIAPGKTEFKGKGAVSELPEDRTKLVKGQTYSVQGKPMKFTGTGFVPAEEGK